jgi:hypothetical protein
MNKPAIFKCSQTCACIEHRNKSEPIRSHCPALTYFTSFLFHEKMLFGCNTTRLSDDGNDAIHWYIPLCTGSGLAAAWSCRSRCLWWVSRVYPKPTTMLLTMASRILIDTQHSLLSLVLLLLLCHPYNANTCSSKVYNQGFLQPFPPCVRGRSDWTLKSPWRRLFRTLSLPQKIVPQSITMITSNLVH